MADQKELFKWDSGQVAAQSGDFSTDLRTSQGLSIGSLTYDPAIGEIYATGPIHGSLIHVTGDGSGYGVQIGTDTNLYRANVNILGTDDSLRIAVGLVVGNTTTAPVADQILADGLIQGLELAGTGQGASYGLTIGTDVQLFRGGINIWDTPDSLRVGVGLVVGDNLTAPIAGKIIADVIAVTVDGATGGIAIGTDTQIYRYAIDVMYSPDSLRIAGGLNVGNATNAPAAGDIWSVLDIRVGGGLYVGSTLTDPAVDTIVADGLIQGLELIATGQGSSYGVTIGTDAQIYRGAADVIDTPDSLRITGGLVVGNLTATPTAGYITATKDIMLVGDLEGLYRRLNGSLLDPTVAQFHDFNVASIPSGWAWAGAPFVTPASTWYHSLVYQTLSATASERSFLYRSATPTNGYLFARVGMLTSVDRSTGIRMDDGTDNNYVELLLHYTPYHHHVQLRYRTGGGAVTSVDTTETFLNNTVNLIVSFQGTKFSSWSVLGLVGFDHDNFNSQTITSLSSATFTWTPTRTGITYIEAADATSWPPATCDWIYIS